VNAARPELVPDDERVPGFEPELADERLGDYGQDPCRELGRPGSSVCQVTHVPVGSSPSSLLTARTIARETEPMSTPIAWRSAVTWTIGIRLR
jgi:hypothetical protein